MATVQDDAHWDRTTPRHLPATKQTETEVKHLVKQGQRVEGGLRSTVAIVIACVGGCVSEQKERH